MDDILGMLGYGKSVQFAQYQIDNNICINHSSVHFRSRVLRKIHVNDTEKIAILELIDNNLPSYLKSMNIMEQQNTDIKHSTSSG